MCHKSIQFRLARCLYRSAMCMSASIMKPVYPLCRRMPERKLSRFIIGQRETPEALKDLKLDPKKRTVWFHASSFGEFAIARPLTASLRDHNIVITFFSPSGYEEEAKRGTFRNVMYLPFDTPCNVRAFLDRVRPDAAVFMVSEYWLGYLEELKKRKIPAILVSALIRSDSVFFKPYGGLYRNMIGMFTRIFCLNGESGDNLVNLGVGSHTVAGDPLFDNAYRISETDYANRTVERFKSDGRLFVAGSIDTKEDLRLVASLANQERSTKFLIVPHTASREILYKVKAAFQGRSMLYSECDEVADYADIQVLIIDCFGELPFLYRYGTWAYVGGGFTKYLHSIIEPVVYGLPVSFGPEIERKPTAMQLIEAGIGTMVKTPAQMRRWFDGVRSDQGRLSAIREAAGSYVASNVGATEMIAGEIRRLADGR